ncbi:MAG TPA: TonB-dependent receptor [Bacteroidaceae bacterium]|nr:TonB-dependent receptor [Bacteroidaceae bacterium]
MNKSFIAALLLGSVVALRVSAYTSSPKNEIIADNDRKNTQVQVLSSLPDNINDLEGYRKTDANIVGHVVDDKTGEHLSYVSVGLKGTTIAVMTDGTGHFFMKNLPEGKATVIVTCVGYKTLEVPVVLKKGNTLNLKMRIQEDAISLDGVVVSANRNVTKRRLAPALVNVVSLETFDVTNSPTLAEGLNFQPGVRIENDCQNCGFTQVRINGLEGPYTQILMDSRSIFSALTGVYGLEQIPATMIERVEVMRGGASALFGSSAIAGTINIITKEPTRNSGSLSHTITNIGDSDTYDNQTSLNLSLVTDDHKAGVYIFGQNRHRSGFDYDGDKYTEVPMLKSQTVGFRSFLKTSDYTKLTAEYHHLQEHRRGGSTALHLPAYMTDLTEEIHHSIDGGGLTFDIFSPDEKYSASLYASAQNTDRDSYYGGYGHTHGLNALVGGQFNYSMDKCLFMPAQLTAGAEYSYESLEDESYSYDHHLDQTVNVGSGFLQNEWKNKYFSILLGARVDKHRMIDHAIVSPRVNFRYNPTENVNLRLGYSEGFRAPQAFDEDLHIGNVSERVSIIKLDPNLKEEKSRSLSLSADVYHRFGDWQANWMIDCFYTMLDDVFILEQVGETDQFLINERTNGSGAKVWGVNLEAKLAYQKMFQLQAGATLQRSMYDEYESWSDDNSLATKTMLRTPDVYGYFTASYNPTKKLQFALNGKYTGGMIVPHASVSDTTFDRNVDTDSFYELGAKVSYDFDLTDLLCFEVSLGVNNIFDAYQDDFDQGAQRDSGYIYGPALPRTIYGGVKLSF